MNYLIKRTKKTSTIIYLPSKIDGYRFKPSNKSNISQIIVVNYQLVDNILSIKFKKMLKQLMMFINEVLASEDSTSTSASNFALNEIERLKEIILNKYHMISKDRQQVFLNELEQMSQKLHFKQMQALEYNMEYEEEVENSRGGR